MEGNMTYKEFKQSLSMFEDNYFIISKDEYNVYIELDDVFEDDDDEINTVAVINERLPGAFNTQHNGFEALSETSRSTLLNYIIQYSTTPIKERVSE